MSQGSITTVWGTVKVDGVPATGQVAKALRVADLGRKPRRLVARHARLARRIEKLRRGMRRAAALAGKPLCRETRPGPQPL